LCLIFFLKKNEGIFFLKKKGAYSSSHFSNLTDNFLGQTDMSVQTMSPPKNVQDDNKLRYNTPDVLGHVTPSSHSKLANFKLFNHEERSAIVSGELRGILRVDYTNDTCHVRMDSFVHPFAWFECTLQKGKFIVAQPIKGRLSEGNSNLVLRVDDNGCFIKDTVTESNFAFFKNPF